VGVGSDQNVISSDLGGDDLGDDVLVGETDDESVSRCVVLVLVLGYKSFSGTVVGLSLASPAVLDLEALEVGLVLLNFDEGLLHPIRTSYHHTPSS